MNNSSFKPYLAAIFSYLTWGMASIYWNAMSDVPPEHLLPYRVLSSLLVIVIIFIFKASSGEKQKFSPVPLNIILLYTIGAILVASNWVAFMYSSYIGRGVEASLGYFLVPFVSFFIGFYILKEPLDKIRIFAILLTTFAILLLLFSKNIIFWIPITIAIPFGIYGYIKKIGKLNFTTGLLIETCVLSFFSIMYVAYDTSIITNMIQYNTKTNLLILGTGLLSIIPLYTFAYAATNLKLSSLGWMQYIAPTTQLIIGLVIFKNTLDQYTAISIVLIWLAILLIILKTQLKVLKR